MELLQCVLLALLLAARLWELLGARARSPKQEDRPGPAGPDNGEVRFTQGVLNVLSYDLDSARGRRQ